MKILTLADGRAFHTVRFQSEVIKQGHELILASLERGDTVDILLRKKSVSNSLNYFFVNRQIKDLVRKIDPDIVNPHFASGYGFSVAVSRVWKKKPVVLHCLGSDILISPRKSIAHKRRVIYALEKAGTIFGDSSYLLEQIKKLSRTQNLHLIPWGVEREVLDSFSKRIGRGYHIKKPYRILVPRPHERVYNNKFIIDSLADPINRGEIKITFPAWGDFFDQFKKYATKLCPEGKVAYYRKMPRREYKEFLKDHDIYLSAALSDSAPASLIEAMACGMVPIVSRIPGVNDWITEKSGLMFDPQDPESLSSLFKTLEKLDLEPLLKSNHDLVRTRGIFENNIKTTLEFMTKT